MGENTSLDLSAILITISIFIPVVISTFFKQYGPDIESSITLKYLSLAGLYMITYCVIYKRNINIPLLRGFMLSNIFLVGLATLYISLIEWLDTLNPNIQSMANSFMVGPLAVAFIILPFSILALAITLKKE